MIRTLDYIIYATHNIANICIPCDEPTVHMSESGMFHRLHASQQVMRLQLMCGDIILQRHHDTCTFVHNNITNASSNLLMVHPSMVHKTSQHEADTPLQKEKQIQL